jgi:hypothetical protein
MSPHEKPGSGAALAEREDWLQGLAGRQRPLEPWRVIPWRSHWPLRWSWSTDIADGETAGLIHRLEGVARSRPAASRGLMEDLDAWYADCRQRRMDPGFAWECLAWTYALPRMANQVSAVSWFALADFLCGLAERVREEREPRGRSRSRSAGQATPETWLCQQLLGAELPLTLGYLFAELPAYQALIQPAIAEVLGGLRNGLDECGLLVGQPLRIARPLLACWTRCGHLVRTCQPEDWDEATARVYGQFVRRSLQLVRPNGAQVLTEFRQLDASPVTGSVRSDSPHQAVQPCGELFAAALALAADAELEAIAEQALPARRPAGGRDAGPAAWIAPAVHSEQAKVAVLRSSWRRGAEHLVVAYDGPELRAELNSGLLTCWSGDWNPAVSVGGKSLTPTGSWRDLCWFSDDDVDYLELELAFADGWHVQRQLVLARQDHFLYIADALLGERPARKIDYRLTLPLTSAVQFRPAGETREGYLAERPWSRPAAGRQSHAGAPRETRDCPARVLPLALPEWRSVGAEGHLTETAGRLELCQQGSGQQLYTPLFLDLDPRRSRQAITWRQLTVAEHLRILPPSVAVGYRVQVGREQWLFYRSLTAPANRTVLGQNLTAEFFAGRFDSDGEADELVRIECEA